MIDFPANPTLGQQFTAAGVTWTWDGTKWTSGGQSVAYLPLAGGTMLGPIVLAADPAAALQPATKQYVDGGRLGDNRLINGDMRIDQRNNGASGTASGYTVDRWSYSGTQASRITWGRASGSLSGFPYFMLISSSSAYALTSTDNFIFYQAIEADMVSDFAWGTANAQPVTLSFSVSSSLSGTFGGAILNYAQTRSYPFTYSVNAGWTKVVIIVPGDLAGTWALSGNGGSAYVMFSVGCGSARSAPAGAWVSGSNIYSANGAVSLVATNGATFGITGVKLEIGSVATPYNRQSLAKSLADCQRYYESGDEPYVYMNTLASANVYGDVRFQASKRAVPSMTYNNWKYFSAGVDTTCAVGAALVTVNRAGFQLVGAVSWNGWDGSGTWTASAEL